MNIFESCAACGKRITDVYRFTFKNDPQARVFCSRECREPFLPKEWQSTKPSGPRSCQGCGVTLDSMSKKAKFCSNTCRMRFQARTTPNDTQTPIQNTSLTDAKKPE